LVFQIRHWTSLLQIAGRNLLNLQRVPTCRSSLTNPSSPKASRCMTTDTTGICGEAKPCYPGELRRLLTPVTPHSPHRPEQLRDSIRSRRRCSFCPVKCWQPLIFCP
jgi:hypothetical protein